MLDKHVLETTPGRLGTTLTRLGVTLAMAVAFLTALPAAARADALLDPEPAPSLTPGQKLRITLPGRKEVDSLFGRTTRREEGTLLGASGTHLGIENPESPGDTLWIGRASIVKLEMSYGEERHPYRGAAYGGVIGALGGLVAAAIETESCQGEFLCGASYIFLPPVCALGGMFIGAVVGTYAKTERWVEIPERDYDIGLRIGSQGETTLAVTVRF